MKMRTQVQTMLNLLKECKWYLIALCTILVAAVGIAIYIGPTKPIEVEIDGYKYVITNRKDVAKCNEFGIPLKTRDIPSDAKFRGINPTAEMFIFSAHDRVLTMNVETLEVTVVENARKLLRTGSTVPIVEMYDGTRAIILPPNGEVVPAPPVY